MPPRSPALVNQSATSLSFKEPLPFTAQHFLETLPAIKIFVPLGHLTLNVGVGDRPQMEFGESRSPVRKKVELDFLNTSKQQIKRKWTAARIDNVADLFGCSRRACFRT